MRGWRIGRILGIDILIDPSWLLIFAFLTWSLSTGFFSVLLRGARIRGGLNWETLSLGVVASLLLFASVLAHELAHSYMAIRRGVPVISITLFFFGGVAQIADEPDRPSTEFWIAIMGPLMSFLLAILFAAFWVWPGALTGMFPGWRPVLLPLTLLGQYLTQANAGLALFNLVPGFPLDGGRVLRSFLWGISHNLLMATRWAMYVGRALAAVFVALGLGSLFTPFGWNGIWIALIGAFVWNAAGEAYRQVVLRNSLLSVTVGEIMTRALEPVPAALSLQDLVERFILARRADVFAVENDGHIVGIISVDSLERVPRTRWPFVTVADSMVSLDRGPHLKPSDPALAAMQHLARAETEELPVLEESGQLAGLVGRADIGRYLKLKHV